MNATFILVFCLLAHKSLQHSLPSQAKALTNEGNEQSTKINQNITDRSAFEHHFQGYNYQGPDHKYDEDITKYHQFFGQKLNTTQLNPWMKTTTISTTAKSQTTTEYVALSYDYPLSGGAPVSSFTFDYEDSPKDEFASALPLGTVAPNEETGDRWIEPNDNETDLIPTPDPSWTPEPPRVKVNEPLSWQVSVFSKEHQPFLRICGASMISRTVMISAAHCFWKECVGLLPASQFAVGAGEVLTYREDDYSSYRQQNDVRSIKVPPTFNGAANNYQNDIAIIQLVGSFYDSQGMRPVCVSFDEDLEKEQQKPGNIATTLGVGPLYKEKFTELQTLKVPYVSSEDCKRSLDNNTLQDFTEDKICAGFKLGTGPVLGDVCIRDPGAGLAFFLGDDQDIAKGIAIPFVRGVASRSHPYDANQLTLYTSVGKYRGFLEENIQDVTEECGKYYRQLGAFLTRNRRNFVCDCYFTFNVDSISLVVLRTLILYTGYNIIECCRRNLWFEKWFIKELCPEACRRWPPYCYYVIAAENGVPGACQFPPYPAIGSYSIVDIEPREELADFSLLYSCPTGFSVSGAHPRCVSGVWSSDFPYCRQGTQQICKGDSGGGLVFPRTERGTQRCYLRGIVSTAPRSDLTCGAGSYTAFTHLVKHEAVVTKFLDARRERDYVNEL
ncbi:uncharacterized protein LOC125240143 [Leguminivora glycinivorella]|uniref:uncharacterized protein LOC125240143 n=1 Tax=Leguminivora glycinivorella TaxID=1035111 RepID=UPI00200D97BD|nr:uncharacterized protein LOC125240143 [Leguminivora glycinivorella]